jgi:hypothetical protein
VKDPYLGWGIVLELWEREWIAWGRYPVHHSNLEIEKRAKIGLRKQEEESRIPATRISGGGVEAGMRLFVRKGCQGGGGGGVGGGGSGLKLFPHCVIKVPLSSFWRLGVGIYCASPALRSEGVVIEFPDVPPLPNERSRVRNESRSGLPELQTSLALSAVWYTSVRNAASFCARATKPRIPLPVGKDRWREA